MKDFENVMLDCKNFFADVMSMFERFEKKLCSQTTFGTSPMKTSGYMHENVVPYNGFSANGYADWEQTMNKIFHDVLCVREKI